MKRNLLNKDLHREMEFLVEYKDGEKCTAEPLDFIITPETLANNQTVRYSRSSLSTNSVQCLFYHVFLFSWCPQSSWEPGMAMIRTRALLILSQAIQPRSFTVIP